MAESVRPQAAHGSDLFVAFIGRRYLEGRFRTPVPSTAQKFTGKAAAPNNTTWTQSHSFRHLITFPFRMC